MTWLYVHFTTQFFLLFSNDHLLHLLNVSIIFSTKGVRSAQCYRAGVTALKFRYYHQPISDRIPPLRSICPFYLPATRTRRTPLGRGGGRYRVTIQLSTIKYTISFYICLKSQNILFSLRRNYLGRASSVLCAAGTTVMTQNH